MILILTLPGDAHAAEVERHLRARRRDVTRIEPAALTREGWLSARTSDDPFDVTLATAAGAIRARDIESVWVRRLGRPELRGPLADAAITRYAENEWKVVLDTIYEVVPARWFPARPYDMWRADMKLTQLRLAREMGFRIPDTLLTSNADDVFAFYEKHGGRIISKLPSATLLEQRDQPLVRFTHRVLRSDLGYLASSLHHAPCLFQEQIPKRTELRITVVGDRVFSAAIETTRNRQCLVDARRLDIEHTPHEVHPLDPDVQQRLVAIVRRANLHYATIDVIVTPEGELVFLELNPGGQYLWIERLTGLPISESISDWLTGDSPARQE
jgi:hypothetical protein